MLAAFKEKNLNTQLERNTDTKTIEKTDETECNQSADAHAGLLPFFKTAQTCPGTASLDKNRDLQVPSSTDAYGLKCSTVLSICDDD